MMNIGVLHRIRFVWPGPAARQHWKPASMAVVVSLALALLLQGMAPGPARAWPGGDLSLAWSSDETGHTTSVAWGDWDGDGDLDLAVGNDYDPNRVYENSGGSLSLAWSSDEQDSTYSVAWGDWDGDGDLDLAVGNSGQPNLVYDNEGGSLSLAWSSAETDNTRSVAWGDWDGDGDLDLAVGNSGQPNRVYENEGGSLSLAWSSDKQDSTYSVAWGDWDGDGDLDLAVGNSGQPNRVYRNDTVEFPGVPDPSRLSLAWSADDEAGDATTSVAWGDWDGDGDLDLAVGNSGQPNRVYENSGDSLSLAWSSLGEPSDLTTSVAWGDWDGDGDLDLAVGNGEYASGEPNRVYRNDTVEFPGVPDPSRLSLAWSADDEAGDATTSVAWGDWDGDGDLDLAVGNVGFPGEPKRVYENSGGSLALAWSSQEQDNTKSVAWGDWDGDGDLDLAVGNGKYASGEPNRVYRNDTVEFPGVPDPSRLSLAWSSDEQDSTYSVAWGDWDGDGDLDLAVGNSGQPNRVYENSGGSLALTWSSDEQDSTYSVAWGDWDGDGDLDLAVGNGEYASGEPNRVYENSGGSLALAWSSQEQDNTKSVAWGDWDGDGDLDLAVGNFGHPNRVYENSGGSLSLAWSSDEQDSTYSVAWGDWDGDGDLDLAVGNYDMPNRVYENSGSGLSLAWSSPDTYDTTSVAWGDWDGDGDFDLAVGNYGIRFLQVYENSGDSLSLAWSYDEWSDTTSVAWGDWDGDGDLDLAVGNDGPPNRVYPNHSGDVLAMVDTGTRAQIEHPGEDAAAPFSSAVVLEGPTLPLNYKLFDAEADAARVVQAYYSLDGGSSWAPAIATEDTITTDLEASPFGTIHTYIWDVYGSGVFGASENAVLRLDVYQGFGGPGPYQYPFHSSRTLPFRVRGSQVRVVADTGPVAGATVYRGLAGYTGSFEPYRDSRDRPFPTNPAGYLLGYGELALGDQLVALLPITHTDSYTLYYTSAVPTPTGLEAHTVTALGVQTLTVSAENALVLFNPSISLEWDARQDEEFLSQLEHDLRRTSEFLYDWTNGQAALGHITVYHDRQHWNDALIRVYASNQLRPSAVKGGIVSTVITDPLTVTVTYAPGQVRMGATWNRYGDPGSSLGEDWPRTLAHELAHFALFLDDDYLGLDEQGGLIPIDSCTGTAMTDPYRDDYSELRTDEGWLPDCQQTLSQQSTGRSDWATVTTLYPWLDAAPANSGPSVLPLAVTEIQFVEPVTPPLTLEVPIFTLFQDGGRVVPGAGARAYLFQEDRLVDLGQPRLDQVLARGARSGDRLCLFQPVEERLGCEVLSQYNRQLDLVSKSGWQPQVLVTPVTSRTLDIVVTNVAAGLSLQARLFPANYTAPPTITLVEAGGQYARTFALVEPVFEGTIQVWVDETETRRETVVDYSLGGNPGHQWSRTAPRGSPGHQWSRTAPVMSSDGQIILFGEDLEFDEGEFLALQALTSPPLLPAWATMVGQAYRLAATPNAPDLAGTSVAFGYLGSDVPPGEELWLKLYFWDGAVWQPLPTEVDLYHNVASAPAQGPGTYALMSSLEISLYGPGWNNFGYPVQGTRPITEALASLDGFFTTVYGWDATGPDPYNRWRIYDVTWDPAYNSLHELAFGAGYWITVTQDITLYLKGGVESLRAELSLTDPPATFYGPVLAGSGFAPIPGMEVTAWVGGRLCGRGETMDLRSQVVYRVSVLSDGPGYAAGCGEPGQTVIFYVDGWLMATTGRWNSNRVWELPLGLVQRIYLPLIMKHG